ncbi:hypothetical protein AQUCO_05200049v1 [Aquilegia coerulea]|uniref:Uncharacterized protein n=1 Tax=Aquilegia coerulea TaxID=218851 RepID=A0A2G5CIS2_AQUCA|nr:hypothetical protein AQUCO_05200049v1 [Aquilegia coerulea]
MKPEEHEKDNPHIAQRKKRKCPLLMSGCRICLTGSLGHNTVYLVLHHSWDLLFPSSILGSNSFHFLSSQTIFQGMKGIFFVVRKSLFEALDGASACSFLASSMVRM